MIRENRRSMGAGPFDDPDAQERTYLQYGRELTVARAATLPAGSPFRYENATDVPDDIARAVALGVDRDLHGDPEAFGHGANAVVTIARAEAEDFHLPRAVENALRVPWTPEQTEELLTRGRRAQRAEPVRAAEKTGRNEACPCGSGRKFKRCCGDHTRSK